MSVLVDTSVWSAALRRKKPHPGPAVRILRALIEGGETIFLTGIVVQELLQGVRSAEDFERLAESLSPYPSLEPSRADHVAAASLFNTCRGKGIQAGTVDLLIAVLAIRAGCRLLTLDEDFRAIASQSKLELVPIGL